MAYEINFAYISHIGRRRANNEDNFWCCGDKLPERNRGTEGIRTGIVSQSIFPIFAVFDGMGGESCGEKAASIAAIALEDYQKIHKKILELYPWKFIKDLCAYMNKAVCRYEKEHNIYSMGTTVAILAMGKGAIYTGNLGDSRIYHLKDHQLQQMSTDHVWKGHIVGKAPLIQYLGITEDDLELDPSITEISYMEGSRYLICSDGLTDMLSEKEITAVLAETEDLKDAVGRLQDLALEKGGRDNITVILCEVTRRRGMESLLDVIKKWLKRGDLNEK